MDASKIVEYFSGILSEEEIKGLIVDLNKKEAGQAAVMQPTDHAAIEKMAPPEIERGQSPLVFNRNSLINGFIVSEILQPPRAYQRRFGLKNR